MHIYGGSRWLLGDVGERGVVGAGITEGLQGSFVDDIILIIRMLLGYKHKSSLIKLYTRNIWSLLYVNHISKKLLKTHTVEPATSKDYCPQQWSLLS